MFFEFHSQTFVLSYCFRQLISGQFVTIRGFLKSRLPDQTAMQSTHHHISQIFWMLANKYR